MPPSSRYAVRAAAVIVGAGMVGLAVTWSWIGLLIGAGIATWALFVAPILWRIWRAGGLLALGLFLFYHVPSFQERVRQQVAADSAEEEAIRRVR